MAGEKPTTRIATHPIALAATKEAALGWEIVRLSAIVDCPIWNSISCSNDTASASRVQDAPIPNVRFRSSFKDTAAIVVPSISARLAQKVRGLIRMHIGIAVIAIPLSVAAGGDIARGLCHGQVTPSQPTPRERVGIAVCIWMEPIAFPSGAIATTDARLAICKQTDPATTRLGSPTSDA